MRRQISHDQTKTGQGLLFFVGLTVVSIISVYFLDKSDSDFSISRFALTALTIICFIGLLYYYSTARFYTVTFDNDFIYFSRFNKMGQVRIDKIINVRPSIFPLKLFYKNVYSVTIEYLDNDIKKKIKFLSKGDSEYGTIDDIPFLDTLRQLIKEKK